MARRTWTAYLAISIIAASVLSGCSSTTSSTTTQDDRSAGASADAAAADRIEKAERERAAAAQRARAASQRAARAKRLAEQRRREREAVAARKRKLAAAQAALDRRYVSWASPVVRQLMKDAHISISFSTTGLGAMSGTQGYDYEVGMSQAMSGGAAKYVQALHVQGPRRAQVPTKYRATHDRLLAAADRHLRGRQSIALGFLHGASSTVVLGRRLENEAYWMLDEVRRELPR